MDQVSDNWAQVPGLFRAKAALPSSLPPSLPWPWEEIFSPLRAGCADGLMVVAQMGQSIDGRIATESGHSKFINGAPGLDHLHRLRALVDAVVVGVGTAVADNPQLTVRRVAGPSPVRVVIDPRGRLSPGARVFADDGTRRIVVTGEGVAANVPAGVEVLRVALTSGCFAPKDILAALHGAGLRRIMIEGGGRTVSGFLKAGCLDRLHVVVAPMLLGAGQPSIELPPVKFANDALRPPVRPHVLGDEVLFDIDLSAQRVAVGCAKTSR